MAKDTPAPRAQRASAQRQPAASVEATHFGPLAGHETSGDAPLSMQLASNGDVQRIGRYEIQGILGRGGMGVVYEVFDPATSRVLALKTIETRFLELHDGAAEHRFRHEIKVLQRLEHDCIVRLFETGFTRHPMGYSLAYYVMEKLEGETLVKDIKANKRFALEEAVRVAASLAEALDYLDANNVLHRDIKPGNIFLERSGRVVLLDFGLARSEEFTRLTLAGQIVGTFSYMSPERLCGLPVNISADVFAAGVVFFQMVAGRHPFGSGTPTDLMASIQRGIDWPESITSLERGQEVQLLLGSMLSMDAKERPSPSEVARRARALLRRPAPSSNPPAPTSIQRRTSPGPMPTQTFARPEPAAQPQAQPKVVTPVSLPAQAPQTPPASVAHRPAIATFDTTAERQFSQPQTLLPAPRTGPSWTVVTLICGSLTCLAFTVGLLVGSGRFADQRRPRIASPELAAPGANLVPIAAAQPAVPEPVEPPPVPVEDPLASTDFREVYATAEQQIASGEAQAAIRSLQRALELNPAFADAHRSLGDAHRAIDEVERATHHYKLYLALRPEAADASKVRAILVKLGAE